MYNIKMSIKINTSYEISSKTAEPGKNKYSIVATDWNVSILEYLKQYSDRPTDSVYGDWILTDNNDTSSLTELPENLKKQFGIINQHNSAGGYSRKRKLKKRPTARRIRSSKARNARKARTTRRK